MDACSFPSARACFQTWGNEVMAAVGFACLSASLLSRNMMGADFPK